MPMSKSALNAAADARDAKTVGIPGLLGPHLLPLVLRQRDRAWKPDYAEMLAQQCVAVKLPEPKREHQFAPPRKWRFDLAWPDAREQIQETSHRFLILLSSLSPLLLSPLAVEIEGGAASKEGGRHRRRAGYLADMEKYNEAVLLGWRVLRVTPQQVESREALHRVGRALG